MTGYKTIINGKEYYAVIIRNNSISIAVENCNCFLKRNYPYALIRMTTLN